MMIHACLRRLVLMLLVGALTGCMADIRPKSVPLRPSVEGRERGGALLQAAAEAHGLDVWQRYDTVTLRLVNRWKNVIARTFAAPWGERDVLEMMYQTDGDDGQIRIVLGPRTGEAFRSGDDSYEAEFFLPAFRFLHALPLLIKDAPVAVYEGSEEWNLRPHEVVYASFAGVKASMEGDQYRVYIDAQTHLVSLVQYTVREEGKGAKYWTVYDTYEGDEGVTLPRLITVTRGKPKVPAPASGVLHELSIIAVDYGRSPKQ